MNQKLKNNGKKVFHEENIQRKSRNHYENYNNLQNNSTISNNYDDTKSFTYERTIDTMDEEYENNHTNNDNSYKETVLKLS